VDAHAVDVDHENPLMIARKGNSTAVVDMFEECTFATVNLGVLRDFNVRATSKVIKKTSRFNKRQESRLVPKNEQIPFQHRAMDGIDVYRLSKCRIAARH
jgi:hypothetical protein